MKKLIVINLKPSARNVSKFKSAFPTASYYGSVSVGSKSKAYLLSEEVYNFSKELIKPFGSKAKYQPFL